ncbi:LacI family transcriptional regulator [Enterococcus florum]|uniref:LacI family transcriptional regulator n=1 Tax=Enterococcus florum TaxID=2480627 RepID=A0A4P5P453_9ENTE|nr:ABC transporter substrate-binding protein [Enterococcus florum]GCF92186.1 LacI family transcriptional regulator [Enterococcus florum]
MKRVSFLVLVLLLLTGCSGRNSNSEKEKKQYVIGFSQIGAESSWRERNTQSVLEAGKKANYKIIYENANQSQVEQIKDVRSFIASRVDLIILTPIVETGWRHVLEEAADANIPVVISDRLVSKEDAYLFKTFVGPDVPIQGIQTADFLKKKFKDAPAPINVVEIQGSVDASPAISRHEGLVEGLKDDPRFKIVASVHGDFMLSKGREAIKNVAKSHDLKQVDVIYCHNDDMADGVVSYLEETDIKPGRDITICSVDGQQSAIDLLKAGKINCVIECDPNMGEKLFQVVTAILDEKDVPKENFTTGRVFSEYSDLTNIEERGY